MPLRSRVALIATLLVVAAIAVNTVLQTFAARRAVLDQARAGGDSIAEVLARAVAFAEEVPKSVEEEMFSPQVGTDEFGRPGERTSSRESAPYSHSIVAGGLLDTS